MDKAIAAAAVIMVQVTVGVHVTVDVGVAVGGDEMRLAAPHLVHGSRLEVRDDCLCSLSKKASEGEGRRQKKSVHAARLGWLARIVRAERIVYFRGGGLCAVCGPIRIISFV